MEKITKSIKKNRITMFGFWIALLYILAIFVIKGVLKTNFTALQIVFIFAIGCFTYVDISLSMEYFNLKKMVDSVKRIQQKYEYMQIYMEKNNMIVEIQKEEIDKLKKDIENLKLQMNELYNDDKLVQFVIKS